MNEFIQKYKKQIAAVLVGFALLAAAFFAGVYSHPTKEQDEAHVEYLTKTIHEVHTVYQDRIVEHTVYVKEAEQKKHTEKIVTETTNKDGSKSVVTKEVTDSDSKQNVSNNKDKTQVTNNTTDTTTKQQQTIIQDTKKLVVNDKPSWRVAGSLGIDFNKIQPQQLLATQPGMYPLVYGVEVDRRLIGTSWIGIWGMTNKSAGLTLSLEF